MIERKERESIIRESVVTKVVCDRCGEEAQQAVGVGISYDYPFEGIYMRGKLWPETGNADEILQIEAELCGPCSRKLEEWMGRKITMTAAEAAYRGRGK